MAKSSISEVKSVVNDIKVYPNPVKSGDNLNIKSAEEGIFTVFSAQGQLIKSGKFSKDAEISTSSLPNRYVYHKGRNERNSKVI